MNEYNLLKEIQQTMQDSAQAMKLCDIVFGTVKTVSPLTVQLQTTMQDLPAAALIETVGVKAKTANVIGGAGGTVTINEGLAVGDKVVMIRAAGGQRYVVLSKV